MTQVSVASTKAHGRKAVAVVPTKQMPSKTGGPKTWIRVSTAAKLIGKRRQTIYYHISEGNIRNVMDMDGVTYVDRDEVLALKPKGKGQYRPRKAKDDDEDEPASPKLQLAYT